MIELRSFKVKQKNPHGDCQVWRLLAGQEFIFTQTDQRLLKNPRYRFCGRSCSAGKLFLLYQDLFKEKIVLCEHQLEETSL